MHKSDLAVVTLILLFACLCLPLPTLARDLVRDGQPQAEIVIAAESARMTRLAARELQTYVKKMSGAELPIVTEPSGDTARIYVGVSPHTEALGLETEGLKYGAYRMASGPDWLALLGPDRDFEPVEPWIRQRSRGEIQRVERELDKILDGTFSVNHFSLYAYYHDFIDVWEYDNAGTLNAVCDFLREQGVRWYFPGELGEIVPRKEDIALPRADRTVRPDFDLRELEYWSLSLPEEEVLWNFRMGLNRGREIRGMTQPGHGMKFVHGRDEYQAAHPEHFALWDGKRATDHKGYGAPCLSSPELFQHQLNYVRGMFDHFGERMMSLDMVDGYGRGTCECEKCAGLATPERGWQGSMSDYVWSHINRVAQEVYTSHPDRMVSGGVYSAYQLPPEDIDRMSPNLALIGCRWRSNFHDRETRGQWRRLRQAWLEKLPSKEWYIRDYYIHARFGGPWQGIPVYFPRLIAEDLRDAKGVARGERIGVYHHQGDRDFKYNEFAVQHLNLYLTTRLWWDVGQDVDAMLEEFYTLFYGPVREEMKAFIEYSEENWPRMRKDVDAIDKALELVEAARTAAGDTVYGERVAKAVEFVQPMKRLREQLSKEREDVPEARALRRNSNDVSLDGKLDEEDFWNVRPYQLRGINDGAWPENATTFWPVWAGDLLYLGIKCSDSDMENLNIGTTTEDDLNIWAGDALEVLIETQYHSYYQIAVNPAGSVTDLDRSQGLNTRWNSGAQVATHRGEDGWTIEIRLPAAGENAKDIDPLQSIAGDKPSITYPWYINVCRQRMRDGKAELTAWSPTGQGRFNVPEKFGKVWSK